MKNYPSKLYYSISEVAAITDVKAHVLRYWESEFPSLRPKKTRTGSRRYRQTDIDEILAIKHLLYEKGFKIAGARQERKRTRNGKATEAAPAQSQLKLGFDSMDDQAKLGFLTQELKTVLSMIKSMNSETPDSDEVRPLKAHKAKG